MRNFLTNRHKSYWANRKIDWKQAYWADHPHRDLIIKALRGLKFGSVIEIGCGAGYNLHKIKQAFPQVEIGGIDISEDAIETAKKLLPESTAVLETSSVTEMFLSDLSCDVILSDAVLIYFDPFTIGKVLKEIKRVGRKAVILVELHSDNWWERLAVRFISGYNLYNWPKLLTKHGFRDVEIYKIPENVWPGIPWAKWGHIIAAKI